MVFLAVFLYSKYNEKRTQYQEVLDQWQVYH